MGKDESKYAVPSLKRAI